mgnify:CR=1 FL=1
MKLLLAEDDAMLGTGMEKALTQAGFTVDWVRTGQHTLGALEAAGYDVVLLDIGLPDIDGLQVLQRMRQLRQHTPVLMVTARDAVSDRVAGLNQGADDYLTKPFDMPELLARMRAVTRRHGGHAQPVVVAQQVQLLAPSPIKSRRPLLFQHKTLKEYQQLPKAQHLAHISLTNFVAMKLLLATHP